jgi:hypothetical protein
MARDTTADLAALGSPSMSHTQPQFQSLSSGCRRGGEASLGQETGFVRTIDASKKA